MKEKWPVFRQKWKELWQIFFFSCYLPSLCCYIFIELCSRKSVLDLGLFLLKEPLVFLYNVLIIAATASVCLLFKRRIFVLSVVLFLWTAIGVTDFVLLNFRTTPFTAVDLALLKDALQIANRYLSWFGVVLIIAGLLAAVALCVYLFRKAKKEEGSIDYVFRSFFCGLLVILCFCLTDIGMAAGLLDRNFGNLAQAFHDNGLPYCFMNSILNTGVERPEGYSSETMGNLLEEFAKEEGRKLVTEVPRPTVPVLEQLTPVPTKLPESTKEPGQEETEAPEVTVKPGASVTSSETKSPETAGTPGGTESTGNPEAAGEPGTVGNPEVTVKPGSTENLGSTGNPEATVNPGSMGGAGEPGLVENPGITGQPEQSGGENTGEIPGQEESENGTNDIEVKNPNIIFLQLESFFDVKYVENFSCTEDPVPFFSQLKEKFPSGFLEVPSIGAGTANTEFECITGMNLDFFGPGEYPYKTVLKEHTCESMAYILKNMGYSASAMHNNDGTFYDRHLVFSNLGFDRYVSIEYMKNVRVNELNWAKDRVLVGQIMKVLSSTKERDYIYAISVQGHGAYPEEPLLVEKKLDVQLPEELSEYYYQYLYYVHQLKEMDDFLKELVLNLSACQEEVVLVLYGDHLPSLGLSDELLSNKNAFQTEYVIWSNFKLEAADKDLQSYQLSARVLEVLGMEAGIMPQYHTYRQDEENYLENMQLLMYDMLYGDMEVYEGENPYAPTKLWMGVEQIRIREVYLKASMLTEDEPMLYVLGQNFTEWSVIAINGEAVETIFLNDRLLAAAELPKSEDGLYQITVRQQGSDEIVLSETQGMDYRIE